MRLKQHREDVKDLRLMADPHVQDIARRYMRLIQMAEEKIDESKRLPWEYSSKQKRVLKDAGSPERDGRKQNQTWA